VKARQNSGGIVIILGIVLLVAAYLLAIPILWTLGIILIVVGVILELLGAIGYAVGGRSNCQDLWMKIF
jgi:uncharacterized membrane protein HdeD (DUF308 family)